MMFDASKVANGTKVHSRNKKPRNQRRTVVGFDHDTFEEIRDFAINNKITFSEAIRTLVVWGLEDVDEIITRKR